MPLSATYEAAESGIDAVEDIDAIDDDAMWRLWRNVLTIAQRDREAAADTPESDD